LKGEQKTLAQKKGKGTPLRVFSGKEATLNCVILQVLEKESPLIAYDIWLHLRAIKGLRHIDSRTAYRRMEALEKEGWIVQNGIRHGKRGGDKTLYELTLKGEAAFWLHEKSIEEFLLKGTQEQIRKLIDLLSEK
jgi:DNA-binding PadR family transcriptional regulator